MTQPDVTHNEAAHQFEWTQDGDTAVLTYRRTDSTITFLHTGVPERLEGRGIASRLAVAALTFARDQRLQVVPLCPFVSDYIRRHPEYLPLVREDYRTTLAQ